MINSSRGVAALAVVATLILSACGQAGASPSATPGASQPDEMAPTEGAAPEEVADRIAMVIDGQITTLSNAAADAPTAAALPFLYNALYTYDASLTPVPDLAEELCEVSEDGTTYTCTLRDGLTFHNGDAVTADDVVYIYQIADSDNCRFNPSICTGQFLDSAAALDERTVEFVLTEPNATWSTLFLPAVVIESRAVIEAAFEEFTGATAGLDRAAAREAIDVLLAETEAEEPDQAACEAALADVEGFLEEAGQALPDRAGFVLDDGSTFDACAYGATIAGTLDQLLVGLESEGVDAVAAVYPLLSFNTQPVGTGPWMCEPGCFAPGEALTLTAFADHHAGAPETETVLLPIITDDVQGANALAAGEVDWKYNISADAYNAIADDPNLQFAEFPQFGYYGLHYNLREGRLFADIGARKAVQYCIDKAETVEVATNGLGVPVEGTIPPASWAYNDALEPVERDTEAAMEFLREAGWTVEDADGDGVADGVATRDGEEFSTRVYVRAGRPDRVAFVQLLRDQVIDCGIEIEVVEGDFATVLLPLLVWPHIPPNQTEPFDAYFGGWLTAFDPDPFAIWHSSQCTTEESPETFNYICFDNQRADELIEAGLATTDQDERAEIYREFEQIVYDEQPYLFAWSDIQHDGFDATLESTAGELQLDSPLWFWQEETLRIVAQ